MPSLLEAIRRRPGMFLGEATITGLGLFVWGVRYAENFHGVPETSRIGGFDFDAFEEWVAARYNPRHHSMDTYYLAFHLAGSERAGFDLWFRWYDEFRAQPSDPEAASPVGGDCPPA
jgi:hypothetical protein